MVKQENWPQEVTVTHTQHLLYLESSFSVWYKLIMLYILNSVKENLALLLQRVEDSKTNVRKSALQVLKTVMIQIIGILVMYVPSGSLLYGLTHDLVLCCSSADTSGASKTWCDSLELGDLGYAVRPLQGPGCVREEEGNPMCRRTACCKSGEKAWKPF